MTRNIQIEKTQAAENIINGQSRKPYADYNIGYTNVSHAGCGAIAIYNVMAILGSPISFSEALNRISQRFFALHLFGFLGINYRAVVRELNELRRKTYLYKLRNRLLYRPYRYQYKDDYETDISKIIDKYPVCIILYSHGHTFLSGGHYITVRKTESGYEIYNYANADKKERSVKDINEFFHNKYKQNHTTIKCIIAVV